MSTAASRSFVAAMHVTLDGFSVGPDGNADWVDSWADCLAMLPAVDAFVLGAGMFPGYELFWGAVREDSAAVAEWLGRSPYPREIEYARIAADTQHLVLSATLREVTWPTARIVGNLDELRAFKAQPGGTTYVVGGAGLLRSLIDDGLLDELRLSVHPVAIGTGAPLLGTLTQRQDLELIDSERTDSGRINLRYRITTLRSDHVQ